MNETHTFWYHALLIKLIYKTIHTNYFTSLFAKIFCPKDTHFQLQPYYIHMTINDNMMRKFK